MALGMGMHTGSESSVSRAQSSSKSACSGQNHGNSKRTDPAIHSRSPQSSGRSRYISSSAHPARATRERGGQGRELARQVCRTSRTGTRPRPWLSRQPSAAPPAQAKTAQRTLGRPVGEPLGLAGRGEGEVQSTPRPHLNEWGSCARHEGRTHSQYSSCESAQQGHKRGAQPCFPGHRYL